MPELVPIRYGRMLASPFAFYRGAAAIMASDLAATPRSGFDVQCCGDAHLRNFGVFGSPERRLVFDVNDFDETLPGPWEWDVKRLSASLAVAARERGFSRRERERDRARHRRGLPHADGDVRGSRATSTSGTRASTSRTSTRRQPPTWTRETRKSAEKVVAKARTRDSMDALSKLTRIVDGEPRIVSEPPLIVRSTSSPRRTTRAAAMARRHAAWWASTAARCPTTGACCSTATSWPTSRTRSSASAASAREAWIVLLLGRDDGDPLFLQVKEAQPSVHEAFLGPSAYPQRRPSASSRDSA